MMKAIAYDQYGNTDQLYLKELPIPQPKPNELLVKIKAVSLNGSDAELLTANPAYVRLYGLWKPGHPILGSDIAGVVEAVGNNVVQFKPGDEVYADLFELWGGFAEYVSAPAEKWLPKPKGISFEEAACVPQAGVIALQGLYKLKENQRVLINGAGGSSGSFAIQMAKLRGADVTAVDNGGKLGMMKELGADKVIDYTKEDFTKSGKQYDLILDFWSGHSVFNYKRSLAPKGQYIVVGGPVPSILSTLFWGAIIGMFTNKRMGVLGHKQNHSEMQQVAEMIESGKIKVAIDQQYTLEQVPLAVKRLVEGKACGKVVVSM